MFFLNFLKVYVEIYHIYTPPKKNMVHRRGGGGGVLDVSGIFPLRCVFLKVPLEGHISSRRSYLCYEYLHYSKLIFELLNFWNFFGYFVNF